MAKLLTVEDETAIRELLAFICETDGHEVVKAASLAEAREALRRGGLDLILLDVMLPDGSGFDFLREVRTDAASASVPVVMITARGDEADRVEGLDAGADDYVVKPFMPRELTARIRAVLRRASAEGRARESAVPPADDRQEEIVRCGPLLMNETRFEATADGMPLKLSVKEFRLLLMFASRPGRVFTRGQLLENIWGNSFVDERRWTCTCFVFARRSLARPRKTSLKPSGASATAAARLTDLPQARIPTAPHDRARAHAQD